MECIEDNNLTLYDKPQTACIMKILLLASDNNTES